MKSYFDIGEIISVRFDDGFLYDKLTIIYRNGKKEVIKHWIDVGWELEEVYYHLLGELHKRELKCQVKS